MFGPLNNESFARINTRMEVNKVKGIPFFTIICFTFKGMKKDEIPNIRSMFAILLPITFPKVISVVPLIEENIFIANSGSDVEKARIVIPIINGFIFSNFPKLEAPSIR